MKLKEDVTGLKWYQDGSTYKRNLFSSETGLDAKAVDAFVDNIVKEHNNHFEIKDPKITEELYFEIDGWNDYNGDNVYVEINFNRDFDRDFNAEKWGEASYGGGRTEHGYVEELLNSGYLEKLGFKDAKVGGTGWNRGRDVPRWNIDLYEFSDYTADHRLKKPTSLDWHSVGNKINGTEPFTVEEGKEIREIVCDKVVDLIKKYPKVIYNCSEPGLELEIVKSRPTSISWNGSYTHNAGYFNLDIDIRDFYNSEDERTYDADEDKLTRVLKEHCAEALNDYLSDYALEVRPDSCEAHWYEGGDDSSVTYFEVAIGFKEAGLENPYDEYKKHTGLSYKGYFDEDPNPNRTFPKRPKKVAESRKRMRSLKEKEVYNSYLKDPSKRKFTLKGLSVFSRATDEQKDQFEEEVKNEIVSNFGEITDVDKIQFKYTGSIFDSDSDPTIGYVSFWLKAQDNPDPEYFRNRTWKEGEYSTEANRKFRDEMEVIVGDALVKVFGGGTPNENLFTMAREESEYSQLVQINIREVRDPDLKDRFFDRQKDEEFYNSFTEPLVEYGIEVIGSVLDEIARAKGWSSWDEFADSKRYDAWMRKQSADSGYRRASSFRKNRYVKDFIWKELCDVFEDRHYKDRTVEELMGMAKKEIDVAAILIKENSRDSIFHYTVLPTKTIPKPAGERKPRTVNPANIGKKYYVRFEYEEGDEYWDDKYGPYTAAEAKARYDALKKEYAYAMSQGTVALYIENRLGRELSPSDLKEGRVRIDQSTIGEYHDTLFKYFDDAFSAPITERAPGEKMRAFSYEKRINTSNGEEVYLISINGEWNDDIIINLTRPSAGGASVSYFITNAMTNDPNTMVHWQGTSLEDFESDLEDCFYNEASKKGSFKEGVSSNYVTPEQRQAAMNKARDYHNALMMAGLQDVDMEMERYVSNQPSERAWYNTIMNSLDGFIDSRVDEDDVDWRSYLTESKQVEECTCSGEFQRLAPVGKNTKMVNLAKKQSLGKKDKYNRLGENKSRRLQEEEIGREIYDFTNNDPDEDVFDVLLEVNGGAMRVEQSELDSLNIHLQNSVHGAYGLYIKGNGKPDVIINDFETGVRTPNYRYKIEVILVNDSDESQRAYSEINKYLADLLGY